MTNLTPLYNPNNGIMKVAGFMSGSGTNLVKIIEHQQVLGVNSPYLVSVIFSDNFKSNAESIGDKFNIPVVTKDINSFYQKRNAQMNNMDVRKEYDTEVAQIMQSLGIQTIALAGYMKIVTEQIYKKFLTINVHPADLSIKGDNNKPIYTGDHAVLNQLIAGKTELRSTIHLAIQNADEGSILMRSLPISVKYTQLFEDMTKNDATEFVTKVQEQLKENGDWLIFPQTLEFLAEGRFLKDISGKLFFDLGNQDIVKIPNGIDYQK